MIVLIGFCIGTSKCEEDWTSTPPNIGSILNCQEIKNKQIHAIPTTSECKNGLQTSKMHRFTGEVRQYIKETTEVDMFYCVEKKIDKLCKEGFLGFKEKIRKLEYVTVSAKQCRQAMRKKTTKYGKLYKSHANTWISHTAVNYKCYWLQEHQESYILFEMRRIRGTVEGSNEIINQGFTRTRCSTKKEQCRPQEREEGIIVWERINHNYQLFRSRGEQTIFQFGNFLS